MCLDLSGGSTNPGTLIDLWHCNGLPNQDWSWVGNALRYKADTSKCVAVENAAIKVGSKLVLENCNGQAEQQFGMDSTGRIFAAGNEKFCISPVDDKVSMGSNLQLFVCAYYREQQFACTSGAGPPPIPAPDLTKPVSIISEAAPSMCLDVPGGKAIAGAYLDLWQCVGIPSQQWVYNADFTFSTMVDKTICLELTGGVKQGVNIQLAKCNAAAVGQRFDYDSKGAVLTSHSNSNLCLDIPGGKPTQGAKLWVWGCNKQYQQMWYVTGAPQTINQNVSVLV
jgi:hypothetical protein